MKKMILLTNSDLGIGAGNTALIVRRAEELYRQKNIETICLIDCKNAHDTSLLKSDGVSFYGASSPKEILNIVSKNNPDYITFYGFKILKYFKKILKLRSKGKISSQILYDMQACNEEKKEYNSDGIKGYIFYLLQKVLFKYVINRVDGCFVVSDELENYCKTYLKKDRMPVFYKVRCGIGEYLSPGTIIENRKCYRQKYGISPTAIVFVYSGFRSPWQKINEIVDFFIKIDKAHSNCHFCFFCNLDSEFEKLIDSSFPKKNFTLAYLSKEEYIKSLCACDVGVILRDYNMTNRVAFPNKFSDYLCSGLLLALNGALKEPLRILQKYDIDYIDTDIVNFENYFSEIKKRNSDLTAFYENNNNVIINEILYESMIKRISIGEDESC